LVTVEAAIVRRGVVKSAPSTRSVSFGASCGNNCREEEGSSQFTHHLVSLRTGANISAFQPISRRPVPQRGCSRAGSTTGRKVCGALPWRLLARDRRLPNKAAGFAADKSRAPSLLDRRGDCSSSKRPLGLSKLHDRIVLLKTYRDVLSPFEQGRRFNHSPRSSVRWVGC
jgi:hypothetical protein